ncbi:MAG: hypothetical protein V4550_05285 [Gemmatimonadota bacterium]
MLIRNLIVVVSLLACSSASVGGPAPTELSVGGSYPTVVSLVVDSCGGSIVQSMPTDVVHTIGAASLSLTHAGSRYDGTVSRNGSFQTTPSPLSANGFSYMVSVAGRFTTTGFDATATVDRTTPSTGVRCRYVAHWIGTKSSGTNVIPSP